MDPYMFCYDCQQVARSRHSGRTVSDMLLAHCSVANLFIMVTMIKTSNVVNKEKIFCFCCVILKKKTLFISSQSPFCKNKNIDT